jgi:hypothetical protein
VCSVGQYSSVGLATCYGLEESKPVQTGPGAHPASYTMGVFPGGKAAGAWRWSSTPSSADFIEIVEPYLYPPSGPSWPVIMWTFTQYVFLSGYAVRIGTRSVIEGTCCCISVAGENANSLSHSLITLHSFILLIYIPQRTRKIVACFSNSNIWTLWSQWSIFSSHTRRHMCIVFHTCGLCRVKQLHVCPVATW